MQLCYHLHLNVVNKDLPPEALSVFGGVIVDIVLMVDKID